MSCIIMISFFVGIMFLMWCILKYLDEPCFLTHKWCTWSDVKEELWERHPQRGGGMYIKKYQDRTCAECGKYEKRYIE